MTALEFWTKGAELNKTNPAILGEFKARWRAPRTLTHRAVPRRSLTPTSSMVARRRCVCVCVCVSRRRPWQRRTNA